LKALRSYSVAQRLDLTFVHRIWDDYGVLVAYIRRHVSTSGSQ